VVQDEAESVLLDTAAAVRGVRAGARTMGEGMTLRESDDSSASTPEDGVSDSDETEVAMVPEDAESA